MTDDSSPQLYTICTDAEMNDALKPDWATDYANGQYVVGAQLPTRDGRITGNAHIVGIEENRYPPNTEPTKEFLVLTDAGTELCMTAQELDELFHPPTWVSDVKEVLRKFSREPWLFTSGE